MREAWVPVFPECTRPYDSHSARGTTLISHYQIGNPLVLLSWCHHTQVTIGTCQN
jgi:hypothetical protein